MRILITGTTGESMPPPYGGVQKLILNTAKRWRERGHEMGITFTYGPKNPDDIGAKAEYFYEYKSHNQPIKFTKILFLIRYFFSNPRLYITLLGQHRAICPHVSRETLLYTAYGVYLNNIFKKFKPDIILTEAALIKSFMAAEIARRHKVPVVVDVYAEVRDLSMGENRYLTNNQRDFYWRSFLSRFSLVIGLDNCSVEMRSYLPEERLKEFVDTGGAKYFSGHVSESKRELREHFKLPQDAFLVGAVGAFELRKGHDHLIEAISILDKKGYKVGVVVCGGGDPKHWSLLVKKLGVEDRVFLFQRLSEEELRKLHRTMDVYTNLSHTQRMCGFDQSLIEAMSGGLPVIVYENGALPRVARNGESGIVVPINKIPMVAEAILQLMNLSPEKRKLMGDKSKEFALKFDYDITCAEKLTWFEELVSKNKKDAIL